MILPGKIHRRYNTGRPRRAHPRLSVSAAFVIGLRADASIALIVEKRAVTLCTRAVARAVAHVADRAPQLVFARGPRIDRLALALVDFLVAHAVDARAAPGAAVARATADTYSRLATVVDRAILTVVAGCPVYLVFPAASVFVLVAHPDQAFVVFFAAVTRKAGTAAVEAGILDGAVQAVVAFGPVFNRFGHACVGFFVTGSLVAVVAFRAAVTGSPLADAVVALVCDGAIQIIVAGRPVGALLGRAYTVAAGALETRGGIHAIVVGFTIDATGAVDLAVTVVVQAIAPLVALPRGMALAAVRPVVVGIDPASVACIFAAAVYAPGSRGP